MFRLLRRLWLRQPRPDPDRQLVRDMLAPDIPAELIAERWAAERGCTLEQAFAEFDAAIDRLQGRV